VDDGIIGPQTLRMANSANPEQSARRMLGQRLRFMTELATWPAFGRGWSKRIASLLEA
jgi:lysozyme family protein